MKNQNRIQRNVYFITTTVVDWIDIFTRPCYKHILVDSLNYCQQNKGLIIYAWVLMTNHLHLLVACEEDKDISSVIRDFKQFTSRKIVGFLLADNQESRREWMLDRFRFAGMNDSKIKHYKFWQDGIDLQELFVNDFLSQKLNYIHQNPVKAEFVSCPEEYLYSSAVDYAGGKGMLKVDVLY